MEAVKVKKEKAQVRQEKELMSRERYQRYSRFKATGIFEYVNLVSSIWPIKETLVILECTFLGVEILPI